MSAPGPLEQIAAHPAMTEEVWSSGLRADQWAMLHSEAVADRVNRATEPSDRSERIREEFGHEQALLAMMEGIDAYSRALASPDYVLGEALGDAVRGFRMLLNGPTGRLICGPLDVWASEVLVRIGLDPDTYEWKE